MDILDPLEKILEVAMALKELVEIFKGKDSFFEGCFRQLNSVSESVLKYKENRNPKAKIPDAINLLQDELVEFKEFLEKEKKRSNLAAFFRGSTMVKESEDHMSNIWKQIHNMNLALSVENQIETNENFKKLISMGSTNPMKVLREKFKNEPAADLWQRCFYQDEQVSWTDFTFGFKKFAFETEKLELTETQIEHILSTMDANHDHLIRWDEWDDFFGSIWLKESEKKDLLNKPPVIVKKCSVAVPPLVLQVCNVNPEDPKNFRYPLKHQFNISEEKVVFLDYEGQEVTILKNWEKEALVFAKLKPGLFKPDVYFHKKITSMLSEKQLQINLKRYFTNSGFFLINLASSHVTSLVIEKVPYVVEQEMIFDLSDALIEVSEIVLPPNVTYDEDSPEYFYISLQTKEEEAEENKVTKKKIRGGKKKQEEEVKEDVSKKKKRGVTLPSITIKLLEGDGNKEPITFTLAKKGEEKTIMIGSDESCDVVIKDIEPKHMQLRYEPASKCWFAERTEECTNELDSYKSYLYLITSSDYNDPSGKPKPGKSAVKLRNGMKVAFNYNEFDVQIK